MSMSRTLAAGAAAVLAAAAPTAALAAGFALKEQSASQQGHAFAGATSKADDISTMFFNPAGLTRQQGHHAAAGAAYVAPRSKPDGMQGATVLGTPTGGGDGGGDISVDAVVPSFYAMGSFSERLKLGLGINVPFGLETEYDDGWAGRYHAVNSELMTVNLNPTVAYKATDVVSIGAGLQAQYVDATLSNAVDFGTVGAAAGIPGAQPGQQDGFSRLEGDDWGFGFTVGMLIEPSESTRFGIAYRSQVAHELTGDVDFDLDNAGVGQALQAATGAFQDTGAAASLTTPDTVSFGVTHALNPRWSVMGELQWTQWSKFEQLLIRFDNAAQSPSLTREDWTDSWFAALGASFRPNDAWTLRAGVAYDESPIPAATRTPRIPGADRHWIALGVSYAPMPGVAVDAGYTHIFVDDSKLSLDASDPGNQFRGSLSGRYENAIDIVALQATLRF